MRVPEQDAASRPLCRVENLETGETLFQAWVTIPRHTPKRRAVTASLELAGELSSCTTRLIGEPIGTLAARVQHLSVELTSLQRIDIAGVELVVELHDNMLANGGFLSIHNPCTAVRRVLETAVPSHVGGMIQPHTSSPSATPPRPSSTSQDGRSGPTGDDASAMGSAISRLIEHHRELESSLVRLGDVDAGAEREELVQRLADALLWHMDFEEHVVYPLVRANERAVADEADADHKLIRDCLMKLSQRVDEPGFGAVVEMLTASIRRHIEEEERRVFPDLVAACTPEQLAALDGEMQHALADQLHAFVPRDPALRHDLR